MPVPYDLSIYPVKTAPPNDPAEAYLNALKIKEGQTVNDLNQERIKQEKLDTQSKQRAIDAAQAMEDLVRENSKMDEKGNLQVNHVAIENGARQRGLWAEADKYDESVQKATKEGLELVKARAATAREENERRGQIASQIEFADFNETDPAKLKEQIIRESASTVAALEMVKREGGLGFTPEQLTQMENQPVTPENQQHVKNFIKGTEAGARLHTQLNAELDTLYKRLENPLKLEEQQTKTTGIGLQLAAQIAPKEIPQSGIAPVQTQPQQPAQDETDYQEYLAALPASAAKVIKSKYPNFSPGVYDKIRRMGLTPEQQAVADRAVNKPDDETKIRHNAAAVLGAQTSAAGYTRAWDGLPPEVRKMFPDPDKWTPETAKQVRMLGQTADQQARDAGQQGGEKPATRKELDTVEEDKQAIVSKSVETRDKELADAFDEASTKKAWENHFSRVRTAQRNYEARLSTLTGKQVEHNDWADKLKAPTSGNPPAPPKKATGIVERVMGGFGKPQEPAKPKFNKDSIKVGDFITAHGKRMRVKAVGPDGVEADEE